MERKLFAVMGATGHVGGALVDALLHRGHKVRAIGRDAAKLKRLKDKGAQVFETNFDDSSRLSAAFSDCDAVFTMIPPDFKAKDPMGYQDRVGERICEAIRTSQVGKVLNLSSLGAQHEAGTGLVVGLHRQEKRLDELEGVEILHMRPCYFMHNFLHFIPEIRDRKAISSCIKGDRPMWMVAAKDIGRKAADLIMQPFMEGEPIFDFVGPRQITMVEATRILGAAIGMKEIKYVESSSQERERLMVRMGGSAAMARLMVEMEKGINEGHFAPTQSLQQEHQGEIGFENFSENFTAAFRAPAAMV
jgi:uncharacterized protein YbjT (DUF2867 family)